MLCKPPRKAQIYDIQNEKSSLFFVIKMFLISVMDISSRLHREFTHYIYLLKSSRCFREKVKKKLHTGFEQKTQIFISRLVLVQLTYSIFAYIVIRLSRQCNGLFQKRKEHCYPRPPVESINRKFLNGKVKVV